MGGAKTPLPKKKMKAGRPTSGLEREESKCHQTSRQLHGGRHALGHLPVERGWFFSLSRGLSHTSMKKGVLGGGPKFHQSLVYTVQ